MCLIKFTCNMQIWKHLKVLFSHGFNLLITAPVFFREVYLWRKFDFLIKLYVCVCVCVSVSFFSDEFSICAHPFGL